MGMAASAGRFLGLTARKTNTEYEGQQINQQRTTLSNQSANYYNQLLGMTVPTPPSVSDFTKTVYTFQDGALNNSITSLIAQGSGNYLISYTASWTDDFAKVAAPPSIVTRSGSAGAYKYAVGARELRELSKYEADGTTVKSTIPVDDKGNYTGDDPYFKTLSPEQIKNAAKEEAEYNKMLGAGTWLTRYTQNTSTGQWTPTFYKKEDLENGNTTFDDATGASQSNIPAYTIGSAPKTEERKGVPARLEQDSTGRIISITLNPGGPDEATYAVKTNTLTDQAKYEDAMNQYEYNKFQYDQSIQEINAKIEITQAQDKNLELRLKQLDTEQKAISTEMDAVQKVIEKNVESTFKTFG